MLFLASRIFGHFEGPAGMTGWWLKPRFLTLRGYLEALSRALRDLSGPGLKHDRLSNAIIVWMWCTRYGAMGRV